MEDNSSAVLGEHVEQEPGLFTIIKAWHDAALCVVQKNNAIFYLQTSH